MDFEIPKFFLVPFMARGVEVKIMSPSLAHLIITCPFPRTNNPTLEEQDFVGKHTEHVVNYLIQEGFMESEGIGIMVFTRHPSEK